MISKLQQFLPKLASKRVLYLIPGVVEVHHVSKQVEIHNISKTGVQFFSNVPIPNQTPIRLKWQDPVVGNMDSQMVVVRSVPENKNRNFMYCYGSKFTSERMDLKKKINQIVETTEEHQRQVAEKKFQGISSKVVNDAFMYGRSYLRNILNGGKQIDVLIGIANELKDYEKESFNKDDEISLWIQKLSTQYFHSRLLSSLISGAARIHEINKLVQDKLQSMECLLKECQTFAETKNTSSQLKQTMNRVKYARTELTEIYNKRAVFSVKSGRLPIA
jgi:acetone carboxylase gamma subunit